MKSTNSVMVVVWALVVLLAASTLVMARKVADKSALVQMQQEVYYASKTTSLANYLATLERAENADPNGVAFTLQQWIKQDLEVINRAGQRNFTPLQLRTIDRAKQVVGTNLNSQAN
jgi:hypothetical protein